MVVEIVVEIVVSVLHNRVDKMCSSYAFTVMLHAPITHNRSRIKMIS